MIDVVLEGLATDLEEATVINWYFEEGDEVNQGDDVVELSTKIGNIVIQAPSSGTLTEVYYDEGESVPNGEVICQIDDEAQARF